MKYRLYWNLLLLVAFALPARAQYVQAERDDTIRMLCKTPFDSLAARRQLAEGTGTIKGVAFTRPDNYSMGFKIKQGRKIYANKIKVILFPVTPYITEYLSLKDKENPRKLRFAYIDPVAWRYRLEAITNTDGEFTFPKMKPGKYYLEGILNWSSGAYYDRYTGSGYSGYNTTNYYNREYYNVNHAEKLEKYVEVKEDGEIVDVKLK